jgi:hypothetical protein
MKMNNILIFNGMQAIILNPSLAELLKKQEEEAKKKLAETEKFLAKQI